MSTARLSEVLGWIGANVRRIRRKKGLTQAQLAELAEQDLSYLQRVERGVVNASIRVVVALADALETPPGLLLRRSAAHTTKKGRPPRSAARRRKLGVRVRRLREPALPVTAEADPG